MFPANVDTVARARSQRRRLQSSVAALLVSFTLPGAALAQSNETTAAAGGQWFVGSYYRYNWVPTLILSPFLERAPNVANHGFGLALSHRSPGGFTAEIGLGYLPYHFKGPYTPEGDPIEDTEYLTSDLAFVHLTGSLLWPIEFHRMLALELGVGLDLGAVIGSLERSEAFRDSKGRFHACKKALDPSTKSPNRDRAGELIPYCEQAFDRNGKPIASSPTTVDGAHYGEKERRVPPLMLFPMLPHVTLRFAPIDRLVFKLEAAFGLAQIWVGVSVQVGLGRADERTRATPPAVPAALVPAAGRVLGKLMEASTNVPIGQASVKTKRSFSAIETDPHGLFIFDKLEPGPVRFEISHPDYQPATCEATVPEQGGDSFVHCFLAPLPKEGAISGRIKDEQGNPVARAHVEITGPAGAVAVTDAEGLFALADAPEGAYRVRVDADGYLLQLLEVEVRARETAMPQILLLKKSATELVKREANELAIRQQIGFEANSAVITAGSDGLLREIADLLLRSPDLALVEVQGHTDNSGARERNLSLSLERADAVRAWLIGAGVEVSRLQARGYGQDVPLHANDTPQNRAKNRRVQLIVLRQGAN